MPSSFFSSSIRVVEADRVYTHIDGASAIRALQHYGVNSASGKWQQATSSSNNNNNSSNKRTRFFLVFSWRKSLPRTAPSTWLAFAAHSSPPCRRASNGSVTNRTKADSGSTTNERTDERTIAYLGFEGIVDEWALFRDLHPLLVHPAEWSYCAFAILGALLGSFCCTLA